MATTCSKNSNRDKSLENIARNSYIMMAKAHVNRMVGNVTEADVKAATGNQAARLKFARVLNNMLVTDITEVGSFREYDPTIIEDLVTGWNDDLTRFTGGQSINPETVINGPRRAMALVKIVDKTIKNRNGKVAKALAANGGKGDIPLLDRALGRPAVVMFNWDKSGIAQKLVRLAMDTPDIINQHFFKYMTNINASEAELTKVLNVMIAGNALNIGNLGLGPMHNQSRANKDIRIIDMRIVGGRREYMWTDKKWHTAGETNLTDKIYKEKLALMVSAVFTQEILDGQAKKLKFRRFNRLEDDFRDDAEFRKLLDDKDKNSKKQYIRIGTTNYMYVIIEDKDTIGTGDAYIVSEQDEADGKWHSLVDGGNLHIKEMPADGYYRSDYVTYIKTHDGKQYPVYKKFTLMPDINEGIFTPEFYEALVIKRSDLKTFAQDTARRNEITEQKLNNVADSIEEWLAEEDKKNGTTTDVDEWINDVLYSGDVMNRVYRDRHGRIKTGNSWFSYIRENYFPHSYRGEVLDEMMDREVLSIQNQMDTNARFDTSKFTAEEKAAHIKQFKKLKESRAHIQKLRTYNSEKSSGSDDGKTVNSTILNKQINSFKSRVSWTDPLKRRKGANVVSDYMKGALTQQFNNELTLKLLEAKFNMTKAGVNHNVVDYAEMKVRQTLGDPSIRGLLGKNKDKGNYIWVANLLNKLPKAFTGGSTYDAYSARKLILTMGGAVSMRVLGAKGALGNNTQILNNYIRYGMKPISEAWSSINSGTVAERKVWDDRVAQMGVDNMLTAFAHFMLSDSTVDPFDMPNIPGTNIPSLTMIDWARLAKLSQSDFVNGKFSDRKKKSVDALLARMQEKYHGDKKQDIRYARKMLHKLITSKKGDSRELVAGRLKALVGNIAEDRFKAMVTWKLSWWFEDLPGKELFTFTGGEKNMRKMTALAAIFDAIDRGIISRIGVKPEDLKNMDEIYTSPQAIEIGRRAVYATMFGMTEAHLGEAFSGIFRLLNQYKGYQTQQTQFEFDTMKGFFAGSENAAHSIQRLHKAQMQIFKHLYNKHFNKQEAEIAFNADTSIDGDAVIMLRLMYTRFLASGLSTFISLVPLLSTIIRKVSVFNFGSTLVRSGESPILSQTIKMAAFTAMFMMGYDDDDEKYGEVSENAQNSILMFTTPALIGLLFRQVTDSADLYNEIFSDE